VCLSEQANPNHTRQAKSRRRVFFRAMRVDALALGYQDYLHGRFEGVNQIDAA